LHLVPSDAGLGAGLWCVDGSAVALYCAANQWLGGADVRDTLVCDARRLCVLQPPGRRLPWRLAWRGRLCTHWLLRRSAVAVGAVRRAVGPDQFADCREAGGAAGRCRGLIGRTACTTASVFISSPTLAQ